MFDSCPLEKNNCIPKIKFIIPSEGKVLANNKKHLQIIIDRAIYKNGPCANLNFIDTSKVTDMSELFRDSDFNGDISQWNVSNVTDMSSMFYRCEKFNQDLSRWDVSNVTNKLGIFYRCGIKSEYKPKFK